MTGPEQNIDQVALRAKYMEERNKRIAGDAGRTVELVGDLAKYLEDPNATPTSRPPVQDESDVIVVGAGIGGLMIGAGLRKAGVKKIRMIDSAGDVGGVWYWNQYPGVGCDTEASVYLPLLEEVGTIPANRYCRGPEIWAHCQEIAEHFDLYEDALLQTQVTSMTWVSDISRWQLTTDRGDDLLARFVVLANGSLQRLVLPDIPGLQDFQGVSFHTSRWDFDYTGGDAVTDPTKLSDKVVGLVGTGATGVQALPALARTAKEVYVFQRTPAAVAPRNNGPVDPEWLANLKPGWQDERRENFLEALYGNGDVEDMIGDGWTEIFRNLRATAGVETMSPEEIAQARERADMAQMEKVRQRIDAIVGDPATAAAMKPYYGYWCKRPLFHDEYLPCFNRPNVHLIDTHGEGINRLTETGAVVDGQEYPLDCVVFATGFEGQTAFTRRIGFDPVGVGGRRLSEKWANGVRTMHGIMTADFPNMCFQSTPSMQSTGTINFPDTIKANADEMVYVISEVLARNADTFEVTPEAEDAWVKTIIDLAPDDSAFLASCTPGRANSYGAAALKRPRGNRDYGAGPLALFAALKQWRATGRLEGLALRDSAFSLTESSAGASSHGDPARM